MGFLRRSQLLDRMGCLEKDVSIAMSRFARNAEVTVIGAGTLAFTCLDKRGKLAQERLRVVAKVKRPNRRVALSASILRAPSKSLYYEVVALDAAPKIITNLLMFGFVEPSAVDRLGALEAPL